MTDAAVMPTSEATRIYEQHKVGDSLLVCADSFQWMTDAEASSVHAIVTDPPYGVKEFDEQQLAKRTTGVGGQWRLPPAFDGSKRAPLPRFTDLKPKDIERLKRFFREWAALAFRILRPGGHVLLASNAFLSQVVYEAIVQGGLDFRGEIIRLVRTKRGGDRPKNAEKEFAGVCSLPRGCYEPWGVFRKPFTGTVANCLRKFGTGGLRRFTTGPFCDVLHSERTPAIEKAVSKHPSLKPQSLMRQLVYASLPLGKGIVLDPFCGGGSTVAAAVAVGYAAIGIERSREFFAQSAVAVPKLAVMKVGAIPTSGGRKLFSEEE